MMINLRPAIEFINTKLGQGLTGCEIGVDKGDNAIAMLLTLKPKILYLIDPWNNYIDPDSKEIIGELQYQETLVKLSNYPNSVILRRTSNEASKMFADNSLDFVYIDADHKFESVLADLTLWYPKIKKGGILAGHDFHPSIPGVEKAVREFCNNKLDFMTLQQDWWFLVK